MTKQPHKAKTRADGRLPAAALRRPGGFTLLEVLVASSLMATVMLGLWGLINIFSSLGDRGSEELHKLGSSTKFFAQLVSDLKSVPRTDDYQGEPVLWGDASTLHFARIGPPHLEWLGYAETDAVWSSREMERGGESGAGAASVVSESPESSRLSGSPDSSPPARFDAGDSEADASKPAVRRIRYVHRKTEDLEQQSEPEDELQPLFEVWRVDELPAAAAEAQPMEIRRRHPAFEAVRFRYFDGQRWTSTWDSGWRRGLPAAILVEAWLVNNDENLAGTQRADVVDVEEFESGFDQSDLSAPPAEPQQSQAESAFALPETPVVPDRPADLTRWVAL